MKLLILLLWLLSAICENSLALDQPVQARFFTPYDPLTAKEYYYNESIPSIKNAVIARIIQSSQD